MSTEVIVVEDDSSSDDTVANDPTPTEVIVEVSENHDVDFAERITRLEERINACATMEYVDNRITYAEQLASDAAIVAEASAEIAVESAATTDELLSEPETEDKPKESNEDDDPPKSKNTWGARWFGR